MTKSNIRVRPDGPYEVRGGVKLVDGEGKLIKESGEEETLYLCRCGDSKTKPFCDGMHREIEFEG